MLWIEVESPVCRFIDIEKCTDIHAVYVHGGNYKVVATYGDRDICVKSGIGNAHDAREFVTELIKQVMS